MKKIIIVISIVIAILCINKNRINKQETIRFRIIANSDSIEDQQLKKKVLKSISNNIINNNVKSIDDERIFIKNNLPTIEEAISQETNKYRIKYGYNHFPQKVYNGKVYEEGDYESLVITLGEGSGNNFWCFLFPPLCMIDEEENIEYESIVKKVINKIF